MGPLQIEAVYEHGTLRLPHELPLQEGQKVTIIIRPGTGAAGRMYGMVPWTGDPEELRRFLNDPDEGQWGSRDAVDAVSGRRG
jgi:predicted DNA-binding antitoxin AbrB/MazE fold protein